MHRRSASLLVLLIVTAGFATAAPPGHRSHAEVPGVNDPDFQKLIEERLRQLDTRNQDIDKLKNELRRWFKDEDIKKLMETLQKEDLKTTDPRWQEQIKKFIEQNKIDLNPSKLTPEELDKLKKLVDATTPKPPSNVEPPKTTDKPLPDPTDKKGLWDKLTGKNKAPPDSKTTDADRADARKDLEQWAKRFSKLADKLEDSPALRNALRDLGKSTMDLQSPDLPPDARLDNQLADLSRYTKDTGKWFDDSWKSMKKLNLDKLDLPPMPKMDLPTIPKVDLPDVDLPKMGSLPSISMPRGGGMPASAGAWKEILLVVTLCVLGVVGWKLVHLWLQAKKQRGESGWQLGAWPIDPARIGTREELVRAFEYLSLLCLGLPARNWNHLDIASKLGAGDADARKLAAVHLAALYEQARYAPQDEPLPADALAAARRNLCLLAGVPAA